jgi:3'(2'), 5'-bisphosphate nucleotidase
MSAMLKTLEIIMKELGDLLLVWRTQGMTQGSWEGSQLKAEADRRAHGFLVEHLRQSCPGIPIISEEDASTHDSGRPDEYWLIDPIDGTASFCNGFDGFVTQVALMRGSQPVLAVVHAPALGLTYTATQEGRALCNHVPISTTASGDHALVLIDNYPEPRGIARRLYDEIGCTGYVESGSIGLKICRLADGTASLFIKDVIVRDWDLAPADLILARAGGLLTTFDGSSLLYKGGFERKGLIAAANRALLMQVLKYNKNTQNRQNTPAPTQKPLKTAT